MESSDDISKSGVYAADVLEFVRQANEYCLWMEESDKQNSVQFIEQAVQKLSGIYHQILNILIFYQIHPGKLFCRYWI